MRMHEMQRMLKIQRSKEWKENRYSKKKQKIAYSSKNSKNAEFGNENKTKNAMIESMKKKQKDNSNLQRSPKIPRSTESRNA